MFAKKSYKKQSLTLQEKRELAIMRADIVVIEEEYNQGIIDKEQYHKMLADISGRLSILEDKYGIC